jgi:hypothetical protein
MGCLRHDGSRSAFITRSRALGLYLGGLVDGWVHVGGGAGGRVLAVHAGQTKRGGRRRVQNSCSCSCSQHAPLIPWDRIPSGFCTSVTSIEDPGASDVQVDLPAECTPGRAWLGLSRARQRAVLQAVRCSPDEPLLPSSAFFCTSSPRPLIRIRIPIASLRVLLLVLVLVLVLVLILLPILTPTPILSRGHVHAADAAPARHSSSVCMLAPAGHRPAAANCKQPRVKSGQTTAQCPPLHPLALALALAL